MADLPPQFKSSDRRRDPFFRTRLLLSIYELRSEKVISLSRNYTISSRMRRKESSFFRASFNCGVVEAPMDSLGIAGKNRTTLFCVIADRDDVIELLVDKFLNGL